MAEQALPLQALDYSFPEAVRQVSGERIKFFLHGRSAELYMEAYCYAWLDLYGNTNWPYSDLIAEFDDPGALKDHDSPSGSIQAEYRRRADNPHDHDPDATRTFDGIGWTWDWNKGQAALKRRGISDPVGIYRTRPDGSFFYTERDGNILLWSVDPLNGGMTWRDLKAEKGLRETRKVLSDNRLYWREPIRIGGKLIVFRRA